MLDFGALKQVPQEKQEAGSRLEDALPAGRWAERVKLALEGRKVPAASSEPSTRMDAPCSAFFSSELPKGLLSKRWGNDLRPQQLLVSSLLTKALKPKTLVKRKNGRKKEKKT